MFQKLHSISFIVFHLLINRTSGTLIEISAQDRCEEMLYINDDSQFSVAWNNEKQPQGCCEVRFVQSKEDSIICTKATEFSVDCNFELRITEGLGIIPRKKFTCQHNTSTVEYCSQKGINVNIDFCTFVPRPSSMVALIVNQTKSKERRNPLLSPVVAKIVLSGSAIFVLSVSSACIFIRRAVLLGSHGFGRTSKTTTVMKSADGALTETSGMLTGENVEARA
ncbi:uncharacterized protein LOC132557976 isoform X2 [Ylistrum balloti]|uniref:uncharacterized protein LOC132557976 isoform X2 n=1 Tax=Ylistrum balloti TaxID=509963 RepID=UPI002905F369|nr:uncharacterized protein LOC132557976 isoform X2 [Ylistrum balloti]